MFASTPNSAYASTMTATNSNPTSGSDSQANVSSGTRSDDTQTATDGTTDEPPPNSSTLRGLLRRAQQLGTDLWPMLKNRRGQIEKTVRDLPQRLRRTANQISLTLELADDYRAGTYRGIRWTSVAVAIAGVIYVVSPIDIIPLPIPVLGSLDDVLVMSLVMRFLREDLERYCEFKGYDPREYFD